jgi:Uma2 family endonuclease
MSSTRTLATYEALLALPEDVRAEIIAGEVRVLPSPARPHALAASALNCAIAGPFHLQHGRGGPGGWWIFLDIDVRLEAHQVVRPDLVGWRRERLPEPWTVGPADVIPDWTCEILSPSNTRHDQVTKRALYARHGVAHYWLVDPMERTLTALRLEQGRWLELGVWDEAALVPVEPFEAIQLEVGLLFPPRPSATAVHDAR